MEKERIMACMIYVKSLINAQTDKKNKSEAKYSRNSNISHNGKWNKMDPK
jgi:hypothetical protein